MEINGRSNINADEYVEARKKILSRETSTEEKARMIDELYGVSCTGYDKGIKNCGWHIVWEMLVNGWCRDFLSSKYISDKFKKALREIANYGNDFSETSLAAISGDKLFTDMSEKELRDIYDGQKAYFYRYRYEDKEDKLVWNIADFFKYLLYSLKKCAASEVIKNDRNLSVDLISYILHNNGIVDRASFYSGRGVYERDLNSTQITNIYHALANTNEKWGDGYVQMIDDIEILAATPFIDSLYEFARNGFGFKNVVDDKDVSLDGLHGEARDVVAFGSVSGLFRVSGTTPQTDKLLTERMKVEFFGNIGHSDMEKKYRRLYCETYRDYESSCKSR